MSKISKGALVVPIIVAAAAAAIAQSVSAQDEAGQVAFNTHCRNCHSIEPADNRLGPTLHNIVGAEASKVEGFANYSGQLTGFKWDEAMLDKFIANPDSVAPNTSMKPFGGIADADERKKVIDFLKSHSKS